MDNSSVLAGLCFALVIGIIGATCLTIHACEVADKATVGRVEQNVDTENFERSEAYRQGLRRDFDELELAYAHAKSDDERRTVLAVLRHRAEGCPPDLVPQDVKELLAKE
jgi:hypothetical protein